LSWNSHQLVLIGGTDEAELAQRLNDEVEGSCLNVCGQLSLAETASVLKACSIVISGDTGPAHMAIAVGTPVLGLYGATYPERSGPYGYLDYVLDHSPDCDCHGMRSCHYTNPSEPGRCMTRIMLADVIDKLAQMGFSKPEQKHTQDPSVLF
jgi:heptosyltransferase-3